MMVFWPLKLPFITPGQNQTANFRVNTSLFICNTSKSIWFSDTKSFETSLTLETHRILEV